MYSGSALVDLKAELSRKEQELGKNQSSSTNKSERKQGKNKTFEKIHSITSKKKKKKNKVGDWKEENEAGSGDEISNEVQEIYAKAQQKLIAKSLIYDKMQCGEMEDVEDFKGETKYLVDFDQKVYGDHPSVDSPTTTSDAERRQMSSMNIYEANEEHREQLHEKWEKEQEEILNGPVHYENIKYDEIRNLGTGYYAFSKNAEERQKQMDELKNMRKETLSVQKKKELLRNKRKAALDARLKKVKQRKAAEEGVDILEDYEEENPEDDCKDNSSNPIAEESSCTSRTDELLKECRRSSNKERAWDQGKDSNFVGQAFVKGKAVATTTTGNTGMKSYEKRLENLRSERADEFAPPGFY